MDSVKITEAILLRKLQLSDAEAIFNTIDSQREYLGKWLPFVPFTQQLEDSKLFVEATMANDLFELYPTFSIQYEGVFAGIVGFKDTDVANRRTEIGYWLAESFQKRGIMIQSVRKLCEMAFNDLELNRIQIKCAVENYPSKAIPLHLGFKLEGVERDGELLSNGFFTDIEVYSLLKSEFKH